MATTNHIALTLLEASQAQKEVTANEAFKRIDALLNVGAKDIGISTPPPSPLEGDVYIIGSAATGAWSGQDNHITYFDQIWRFITPHTGSTLWSITHGAFYQFDGNLWTQATTTFHAYNSETLYIPSSLMRPSLTNGCSALSQISLGTNAADIYTLDFDSTTDEYATFTTTLPHDWDLGDILVEFIWSHANAATNYSVVWSCEAAIVHNGDSLNINLSNATNIRDIGGTENTLYHSPTTPAIQISGTASAGALLLVRVGRNTAHSNDTLDIDARLHGIKLHYNVNNTL